MDLSYEVISQFAKVINNNRNSQSSEATVYGVVVEDGNGNKYVKLDGSDQMTPLSDDERPSADLATTNTKAGDRVSVLIKNHTATVTGNTSSPSVRTEDFDDLSSGVEEIKKFDIVIADKVQANEGYIKKLQADKAEIGDLKATTAEIENLKANKAEISDLKAAKAEIEDLKVKKIDAEEANIKYATVENLKATNANIDKLTGKHATFESVVTDDLKAVKGNIKTLDTEKLNAKDADIKYAQIQDLNATNANIDNLVAQHADLKNAIVGASSTETGIVINLTAENATISEALIKELIAQYITVNDLKAGNIITDKIKVMSQNGRLQIAGNTFTIYDENDVPIIQLGQDKNGNYGLVISDSKGAILLDSEGLHEDIVPDNFIKTEMVGPGQITEEKIDKTNIRNWTDSDGSKIFDVSKMYYGDDKFEVSYSSVRESVKTAEGDIAELQDTVASLGNGYTVVLSNESQNIPCTSKGITAATFNIEIPFKGYVGIKQLACTVKISDLPSGITLVKNTPSTDTSDGLVVLNVKKGSDLGESSVLTGSIVFTCVVGGSLISKKFIWTKTLAGEQGSQGSDAVFYYVTPSVDVITSGITLSTNDESNESNANSNLSPESITFDAYQIIGNNSPTPYPCRFIISEYINGADFTVKYTSLKDESTVSYSPSSGLISGLKCVIFAPGDTTTQLDSQTVPVITDSTELKPAIKDLRERYESIELVVDQVNKEVRTKATQQDIEQKINDYDGSTITKVRDQISEQISKVNEFSSKVSDVESKIEKKADGTEVTELTNKVSKIEQDATSIKQTLQEDYTKTDDVNRSIKSAVEQTAKSIKSEVAETYGTKKELSQLSQTAASIEAGVKTNEGDIAQLKIDRDGLTSTVSNLKAGSENLIRNSNCLIFDMYNFVTTLSDESGNRIIDENGNKIIAYY